MNSPAPATDPASPVPSTVPMAEGARWQNPTAVGIAAVIGGFIVSLIGHSAFVIWGIGLWDMATPLSAAPPASVMVDLVDDPWRIKPVPDLQLGEAAAESSPAATSHATESPAAEQPVASPAQTAAPVPFALPSMAATDDMPAPDTPTGLRIAQMLQVPVELPVDLPDEAEAGGAPAETIAELARTAVDDFKDRLRTCWTTPPEALGDDRIKVLIRVALQRDGSLRGEPALIQAVATPAGPAVVKSAIAALRKCQPYAFLPAEQYKQWRMLDIAFSAEGVL